MARCLGTDRQRGQVQRWEVRIHVVLWPQMEGVDANSCGFVPESDPSTHRWYASQTFAITAPPARMIVDMLRCYSSNNMAWCGKTGIQGESFADTMEPGQGGAERFSANYGQSYTRGMVCRTPKHFVWSAHAAGTEAKLSFCGIPGESGSLGCI